MLRGGQPPLDETVLAPIHHRAKWELEDALSASSLPWSVLRQPIYLENFANDEDAVKGAQLRLLKPGSVSGLLAEQVPLTVIAVADLGALAVRLFGARDRYLKRVLTAGAERITGLQLAASAARVNGRMHFQYKPVPWYVLEYFLPVEYPKQLRRWLTYGGNDEGAAGLDFLRECRELHPGMASVDDWLEQRGVAEFEVEPTVFDRLLKQLRERLMQEPLQK